MPTDETPRPDDARPHPAKALARKLLARLGSVSAGAWVSALCGALYMVSYWLYRGWRVGSDGYYSWVFARSMAFDNDLHFANDYALCGDPWNVGHDEGGGRPANPFYFGPALLWAPFLKLARWLVHLPANASAAQRAGCEGPLVDATLWIAPLCGALALYLGYRCARRYTTDGPAAIATAVLGLGSPLMHYASLITSYSHVWTALGTAVALMAWVHALGQPEHRFRWFLCGLGVGFAALMRIQAGMLLLLPALVQGRLLLDAALRRDRPGALRAVSAGMITLLGFILVFSLQLAVNKVLYGAWWVIPQGRSYVRWGHGQPFTTLFAARAGLLYWHPLLWTALLGAFAMVALKGRRLEGAALLVVMAADTYLNSCAYWHGGASFGARRHIALTAPMLVTAAVFLGWLWSHLRSRPRLVAALGAGAVIVPWAAINLGMSGAMQQGRLAFQNAVPAHQLYSVGLDEAVSQAEQRVGNPLVMPFSLLFAARYQTSPSMWTRLSDGGLFDHGYRPVVLRGPDAFEFADASHESQLVEGFARTDRGARLRAGVRGRALLELDWPWITHLQLTTINPGPNVVRLVLRNRTTLFSHDLATLELPAGASVREFAVAPGALDGGINELLFESNGALLVQRLRFVDRMAHDTSVH